jgi:hypothetical protein
MAQAPYTGMYDLLEAIEDALRTADFERRNALASALDRYAEDNARDFFWATGPQAPSLLHHIILAVDLACRSDAERRQGRTIHLVHRRPDGHADKA